MKDITKYLKPRTIIFLQGKGFIEQAILACQNIYVKEKFGVKSKWSHIGIIADDGLYYESTISIATGINGVKVSTIKKAFSKKKLKDYNRLGFQYDLKLSDSEWWTISHSCWKAKKDKLKYGTLELFGTLFTLTWWKISGKKKRKKILQMRNPFDSIMKVYCIAFVNDMIESCGREYLEVESSISTVDEAWINCKIKNKQREVKV